MSFTTGSTFVRPEPTAEQIGAMLGLMDRLNGANPWALADSIGIGRVLILGWLEGLEERGLAEPVMLAGRSNPLWHRVSQTLDPALVRSDYVPKILAFLEGGRRELPGGIARALRLNAPETAETCRWLQQQRELVGKRVGSSTVYAARERVVTYVDPEVVARLQVSGRAQLDAHLASLSPERAVRLIPQLRVSRDLLPLKEAARKAKLGERYARSLAQRGRVSSEGLGEERLVSVEGLKLAKTRRRPVKPTKQRSSAARQAVKPLELDPDRWLSALEAKDALSIKYSALMKWLSNQDDLDALVDRSHKALRLSPKVLEIYHLRTTVVGARRGTEPPAGALDIWQTVEMLGWSYTKVYKMLAAGKLSGVQVGRTTWFDPEGVIRLKAELDAQSEIPSGWTKLIDLASELELDRSSVTTWFARKGWEVLKRRDDQRQLALFVSPEAAAAYREFRVRTPGGVKITPEVTELILEALPQIERGRRYPPGVLPALAERLGISTATIHNALAAHRAQAQAAD